MNDGLGTFMTPLELAERARDMTHAGTPFAEIHGQAKLIADAAGLAGADAHLIAKYVGGEITATEFRIALAAVQRGGLPEETGIPALVAA